MFLSRKDVFRRSALGGLLCAWLVGSTHAATLSGTFTPVVAGTAVDLSAAGVEWAQWGLDGEVNRIATVAPLIGDLLMLGPNGAEVVLDFPVLFSWTNGTPTVMASNVTTAFSVKGLTNGFELNVPANALKRKLRLYVGCAAAQGKLDAVISD